MIQSQIGINSILRGIIVRWWCMCVHGPFVCRQKQNFWKVFIIIMNGGSDSWGEIKTHSYLVSSMNIIEKKDSKIIHAGALIISRAHHEDCGSEEEKRRGRSEEKLGLKRPEKNGLHSRCWTNRTNIPQNCRFPFRASTVAREDSQTAPATDTIAYSLLLRLFVACREI